MTRLIKAGLALALITGLTGCIDLNEKLVSSLGSSYVSTPQGLTDATNALYNSLGGFYGRGETDYSLTQIGTDTWTAADQISSGGAQNWIYLDTYAAEYNSLASFHDAFWGWGYGIISRANLVLDQSEQIPVGGLMTQAVKDSRVGEARFMRGLAYFNMVQHFGPLTVMLKGASGISTEAQRESEDSVYKVIIDDVTKAVALLPTTQSDYGRVTKPAAQMLLARVYLTRAYLDWNAANKQADFQKALDLANTIISSGQFSLLADYARLWCAPMRAGVPADPGGTGFCENTGYAEKNSEFIWTTNFTYVVAQQGPTNYDPVEYLSQYDADGAWAGGIVRDLDRGRPFRRLRPTPYNMALRIATLYAGQTPGPNADVVDTRFNGSFQTVWHANSNGSNPTGTCPKCTSGAAITGTLLKDANGGFIGPGVGSDTALVYLPYQVTNEYRQSKKYRIGTPCTTAPTEDCGRDNDALGMWGFRHYPSLKKFQDNLRIGGVADLNGGKDFPVFRLADTYLIAAEAAVGLGQPAVAATNVNILRNRAACKGPPLCRVSHVGDPAFVVTAAQMNLDFIMEERERELGGEYTRWTDIRRPGKTYFLNRIRTYNPYARPNVQDKNYYRPIPQTQINGVTGTPYPQNAGWQ